MANKFSALLQAQLAANSLPSAVTTSYDRDAQKYNFSMIVEDGGANTGRLVIFDLTHGSSRQTHFDVEIVFESDTRSG
eukprot:SAG22_NODE_181_length_16048_cov_157.464418_3_plen_78_part_00